MQVFGFHPGAPSTVSASLTKTVTPTICQKDDGMSDFQPVSRFHSKALHLVIHHDIDTVQGLISVSSSSIFMVWNMRRGRNLLETFHLPPKRRESLYFPHPMEMKFSTGLTSSDLGYPDRDLALLPPEALEAIPLRSVHCITPILGHSKVPRFKDGVCKELGLCQHLLPTPQVVSMTWGGYSAEPRKQDLVILAS